MKMMFNLFIFLLCITTLKALSNDIPPYVNITKCKFHDPELNKCLLIATEEIKPFLAKGIPELGMPPIEPLIIPKIHLEQGTNNLNFKAVLTNIETHGLSDYTFSQFDFDTPNLQWFIKATIGPMVLKGSYSASGRILLAAFEGNGTFVGKISGSHINAYQKCKLRQKKGEEYFSPIATNTTIRVSEPKIKIEGLFGKNNELNEIANRVINENADALFEDLRPAVEEVIVRLLEDLLLRSLEDNIPFKKLYPQ